MHLAFASIAVITSSSALAAPGLARAPQAITAADYSLTDADFARCNRHVKS